MNSVRVKIAQGVVKGLREKLPDGRSFDRFSRIPYAEKPIDELRFRSPKKLIKFERDEIDCTIDGDGCVHQHIYSQKKVGSEDCLYLNVYVPANANSSNKLAVMVYIHGGGFSLDSSSIEWYSPEYLLTEDVIVVTINYRLHALGFLCLPSMDIPGNAGLKDQQMALEWVYDNISSFNGDRDNICLFGISSGGVSVDLQVLNQTSRSFIKSAICQSGTALGDWVIQKDGIGITRTLAKLLGCKTDDDGDVYQTLMKASPMELFKLKAKPQDPDERRRNLPPVFKPVIESSSADAFMTKPPVELLKSQKDQINIPMIFGTTDKEGIVTVSLFKFMMKEFEKDPVRMVPTSMNVKVNSDHARQIAAEIKQFYFGTEPISDKMVPQLIQHMTDVHFLIPQTLSNELMSRYQKNCKQFLYEFAFDGELNHYKKLFQMEDIAGAGHCDDVSYLFYQRAIGFQVDVDSKSHKVRQNMCKMWTNFAKYHDPTPEHDDQLPFEWTAVQPIEDEVNEVTLDHLVINDEMKMVRNLNKDRIDFWRRLYGKWNQNHLKPKL